MIEIHNEFVNEQQDMENKRLATQAEFIRSEKINQHPTEINAEILGLSIDPGACHVMGHQMKVLDLVIGSVVALLAAKVIRPVKAAARTESSSRDRATDPHYSGNRNQYHRAESWTTPSNMDSKHC